MKRAIARLSSVAALISTVAAAQPADPEAVYRETCAQCHGADRLGGTGPALIPESLVRLRREAAVKVISEGRAATQMPGFGGALAPDAVKALAAYLYTPLATAPKWDKAEIEASRVPARAPAQLSRPKFDADPLNLFVVVEAGDHHVTILNGDTFTPIHRFQSRFALHGGPKFTRDGRFVFFGSRDGWITKYDLWNLEVLAEVRAGLNTRNIAISSDAKHIAVANYLPHTLVMLSADDLSVEKVIEVKDAKGRSSRVSAVYQAPQRSSFIAALKDVPEVWEIATDPNAPPVYGGFVHSHETGMKEGLASSQGLFALRRIEVEEPIDDFFFDPEYRHLLGSARDSGGAMVVNLNVGRTINRIPMGGLPHLGSGISWMVADGERKGHRLAAMPNIKEARLSIIDMTDWSLVTHVETLGPGFFMRSHEGSPNIWMDVMMGPAKDSVQILDKASLKIVATLKPAPGKTAAHVEFDRYGRHALVSLWENDGALVVYDAATFKEVKRIPMAKPSGKYNVFNKITFSEGTSH